MPRVKKDDVRENRIEMEVVVDAYGEVERAMGWHCYLGDKLTFPFRARCFARRATSPLRIGDEVQVAGMASEEECEHEMLVKIRWQRKSLAVPLSQLEVAGADEQTREAVEGWHYWVKRGYEF